MITSILKRLCISYRVCEPREASDTQPVLVLTTRHKRDLIRHPHVLCVEDLEGDSILPLASIYSSLYGEISEIVVGIDPGSRIGVVICSQKGEIESQVMRSVDEVILRVSQWVSISTARRKIVRIGNGDNDVAYAIAGGLAVRLGDRVNIEIVDEHGTSTASRPNRRGFRDVQSARIIAFREGRPLL